MSRVRLSEGGKMPDITNKQFFGIIGGMVAIFIVFVTSMILYFLFDDIRLRFHTPDHEDFFRKDTKAGAFFYEISELLSSRHPDGRTVTIYPLAGNYDGSAVAISEESMQLLGEDRLSIQASGGAPRGFARKTRNNGGVFCGIFINDANWNDTDRFLTFEEDGFDFEWLAFWHEVGHCYHASMNDQNDLMPTHDEAFSAFSLKLGIEDRDELSAAIETLTQGRESDPLRLIRATIVEGFADAFFYTVSVEHGLSDEFIERKYKRLSDSRLSATHYTSYFIQLMRAEAAKSGVEFNTTNLMDVSEKAIKNMDLHGYVGLLLMEARSKGVF